MKGSALPASPPPSRPRSLLHITPIFLRIRVFAWGSGPSPGTCSISLGPVFCWDWPFSALKDHAGSCQPLPCLGVLAWGVALCGRPFGKQLCWLGTRNGSSRRLSMAGLWAQLPRTPYPGGSG